MSTFTAGNLNPGDFIVIYNSYDSQYALHAVLSMSDEHTANLSSVAGKENILTTLTERTEVNEAGESITVHVLHQTRKWTADKMVYLSLIHI